MATGTSERYVGHRRRDVVAKLASPTARLVCMYLDRVPSAYVDEIERDLQLPPSALEPVLASLVERGIVGEREDLYVLGIDPED